jgi:CRISPR system Cascade subunit CasD
MTTLLLTLAAPLQAWGDSSRFVERRTRHEPTKSGVLGLLAAALGRRRTDPIEDLVGLRFGVRSDQPGTLTRDFQTAIDWRTNSSMPLSHRYYLADAVFVAAVEGDQAVIDSLVEGLRKPTFPLYLGRRSCPPAGRLEITTTESPLADALAGAPWQASRWHRRKQGSTVRLTLVRDARPDEKSHESIRDLPVSFDPNHRQYGWRDVVHDFVEMNNPDAKRAASFDWLAPLGGS